MARAWPPPPKVPGAALRHRAARHVSPERGARPLPPMARTSCALPAITMNRCREAARLAATHGWQVIADTSYDGYEDIPRDVMRGLWRHCRRDRGTDKCTAWRGLGFHPRSSCKAGWAAWRLGLASYFWEYHGPQRPCVLYRWSPPRRLPAAKRHPGPPSQGHRHGRFRHGWPGLWRNIALAWRFLQPCVDAFHDD